jgi:hypothetical protein
MNNEISFYLTPSLRPVFMNAIGFSSIWIVFLSSMNRTLYLDFHLFALVLSIHHHFTIPNLLVV